MAFIYVDYTTHILSHPPVGLNSIVTYQPKDVLVNQDTVEYLDSGDQVYGVDPSVTVPRYYIIFQMDNGASISWLFSSKANRDTALSTIGGATGSTAITL